jgi:hypothetical protein
LIGAAPYSHGVGLVAFAAVGPSGVLMHASRFSAGADRRRRSSLGEASAAEQLSNEKVRKQEIEANQS